MNLGLLVRDARRQAGLTQTRLAAMAGTTQTMGARYETAAATPSLDALQRLLYAAGLELTLTVTPVTSAGRVLDELRRHRGEIIGAAQAAGAPDVRVFGSAARREDTSESDVDLLVDFPVHERGLLPLLQIAEAVRGLTGRDVDVATPELLTDEARRGPGRRSRAVIRDAQARLHDIAA